MTADLLRVVRFIVGILEGERRARLRAAGAMLAGLASGAVSAALIGTINTTLAQVANPDPVLLWRFLALCLLLPAARFTADVLMLQLTAHAICQLRISLSRRILDNPLRRLEELGAARIFAALTGDVSTIAVATAVAPALLMNLTLVAGCLAYLGWLSWRLLLLVLVVAVTGILGYRVAFRGAYRYFERRRNAEDQLFEQFRGLTAGFKELKLNRSRRRDFLDRKLEPTAVLLRGLGIRGGTLFSTANSLGNVLFYTLIGVILFALPRVGGADLEVLTGYVLVILFIMVPIDTTLQSIPTLTRAGVAVEKIRRVGLAFDRPPPPGREAAPPPTWRELEMRGVTSVYPGADGHPFTLGPIDVRFQPGQVVFLVGGNGSGKTTFAKILTGLYAPTAGEILVDGRPVTDAGRDHYRQLFSAVFADFFLFKDLLGLPGDDLDRRAAHYLEELDLAHKVRVEEGTLSTLELSQGQRKRLALLVSYLEDRPIYLFDEWAADQDPQFKRLFYLELLPELRRRGKTVFVISHDDAYFHLADRLVRFDFGRISSPDARSAAELLAGGGQQE